MDPIHLEQFKAAVRARKASFPGFELRYMIGAFVYLGEYREEFVYVSPLTGYTPSGWFRIEKLLSKGSD